MLDDKVVWGDGPWLAEHDGECWTDPDTGLRVALIRSPIHGAWQGGVLLPSEHPWRWRALGSLVEHGGDVHGGITWVDVHGWIGFDCAHLMDYPPRTFIIDVKLAERFGDVAIPERHPGEYRTIDYAREHVLRLARIVKETHDV
jgi:hypothetical protein